MDNTINDTSSYLDLSPVYGNSLEDQNLVRAFVDGKLKPDTFSESRVLGFPPGVSAFLVCFSRFHNYVVGELASINEGGRFSMPVIADIQAIVQKAMPKASKEQIAAQAKNKFDAAISKRDNDLFQTGRLYLNTFCIFN